MFSVQPREEKKTGLDVFYSETAFVLHPGATCVSEDHETAELAGQPVWLAEVKLEVWPCSIPL